MEKKLAGKVAVVTGASKGIGASIAKYLAAEGAAVVVNYSSSKSGADRVVSDITSKGGKAVAVQASVANATDVERLFAETKKLSAGWIFSLTTQASQGRRRILSTWSRPTGMRSWERTCVASICVVERSCLR